MTLPFSFRLPRHWGGRPCHWGGRRVTRVDTLVIGVRVYVIGVCVCVIGVYTESLVCTCRVTGSHVESTVYTGNKTQ